MANSERRFAVAEYHRMIEAGVLTENDRIELIRGQFVERPPTSAPHAACSTRLSYLFHERLGDRMIVSVHNPVELEDSEPEPDVKLLRRVDDHYRSGSPRSADVLLLVEIADQFIEFDRDIKGPLYAENGIREYWIVDLLSESIEIYREPVGKVYRNIRILRRGEAVSLLAFPDTKLKTEDVLGE